MWTTVLVALGAAVLASCSPIASLRPASGMMPGKSLEFGVAAATVSPRPYVIEERRYTGQVWASHEPSRVVGLSLLAAFDAEALALGGALRLRYLRTDRFSAAGEVELGYLWAAVSAPLALRLFDQTYLYASPRLGSWGLDPIFGVPIGLSVRLYDGLVLRGEWQRSWQGLEYFNRRDHLSAGVVYQF